MYNGGECGHILDMVFLISRLVQTFSLNWADLMAWFSVFLFYFYDDAFEKNWAKQSTNYQQAFNPTKKAMQDSRERERVDRRNAASDKTAPDWLSFYITLRSWAIPVCCSFDNALNWHISLLPLCNTILFEMSQTSQFDVFFVTHDR